MADIERIYSHDRLLAIIVPAAFSPSATHFVTDPDINMQVGLIKYPQDGVIQAHIHRPIERHIVGTGEVLLVRQGEMELALYDGQTLVAKRVLGQGDLLLLISGGHGIRMLQDSILLEVKQGPYTGLEEKERFEA